MADASSRPRAAGEANVRGGSVMETQLMSYLAQCARWMGIRVWIVVGLALFVTAAGVSAADEPSWTGNELIYPEGAAIPRSLTDVERLYLQQHPISARGGTGGPPSGPIHCVAEYEPMDALLMSWEGSTSWKDILAEMSVHVTTTGDADVYMMVDSASEQTSAWATMAAAGVDMDRVHFSIVTTDTIWIRDYGPRYIYQGQCRAIVDHIYNRPRPYDDVQPYFFSDLKNHALYELDLTHGGGNYHLNALGSSHTSRLVIEENPNMTEQEIHDLWQDYQNVDTMFHEPLPSWVDSTQHIDMWLHVIADDRVVISDWPFDEGSTQDVLCDAAADQFAADGYTVHRVPARSVSYTHYTYTNVVMCNDLVLIPLYTHSSVEQHNAEALAVWQAAMPDKTIVQIDSQSIVTSAGVLHCLIMHLPVPLGGENPTVYLVNLRGGDVLAPGSQVEVRWISDDDVRTESIDILLSADGGTSYPLAIVSGTADDGSYLWTVPNLEAASARLRLVVHDGDGHAGFDQSDDDFIIDGLFGDHDLDGSVDLSDYAAFVECTTGPEGGPYPTGCEAFDGDLDLDVDAADFGAFQRAFTTD